MTYNIGATPETKLLGNEIRKKDSEDGQKSKTKGINLNSFLFDLFYRVIK